MARRVIGLDVGTYSVKVVHLEARAAGFDIHTYSELPLSRFAKEGQEQSEFDLQKEALAELKRQGHLDGSWIVSGLPSTFAQLRSLDVPFTDAKKIEAVLPGLMDSHLPFSVENLAYTWFPIGQKPVGAKLLVGFARKENIGQNLAQLRSVEVDPRILTVKAAALYDLIAQAASSGTNPNALYGVIDIGHKSTGICVGDKQSIRFARSVPKGGFYVTQNLSERSGMTMAEAEAHKIEAREMSDMLREAYYPIAREIRQTILAMESETHQKVEQIFLVGGGAKATGLAEFLSKILMTNVSFVNRFSGFANLTAVGHAPTAEAGLAISYALLGENTARRVPRFNFRKEEFAFSGELGFVRQRGITLGIYAAVLIVLLGFTGWLNNYLLAKQFEELSARQQQSCPAQAAGQKMSAKDCYETMLAEINYRAPVPESGSTDILLDLSVVIPAALDLKFKSYSIDPKNAITFTAETSSTEAVDELAGVLRESKCFDQVVKKNSRVGPNGVVLFDIEMKYNCNKVAAPVPAAKPVKEA